ncbi:type II secretion system protein GspK [Bradyrhizobium sp. ARR65]|uniref:general secretion pathway protein GspK n=1 Tax=Bradyrhizobium sp. ARR65 TaxID=1040989 RepID=UPI0004643F45|nr:type II secretion system protein GspK [Bradyrhizobium sp. ARR65]
MSGGDAGRSPSQRGFVIVAVLWILLALSALAMVFAAYLSASTRELAISDSALKTEALVSASLELTAYQLALAGDKARPPQGSFHFGMDDANVLVTFTSEAARVDLNFAPKEVLAGLFAVLGASKDAANEDADRIVGWRTRPISGGTNEEEALYNAVGYSPRQSLFAHADELALVVGLPPALVERALPFVTVFNGSPDVDPTIAAPEVLAALPDTGAGKPQDPFNTGTAAGPAQAKSNAPAAKSPCYRIETAISFRDGRRTASEVVIALGDQVEPYRVLSWQDDVQPLRSQPRRGSS